MNKVSVETIQSDKFQNLLATINVTEVVDDNIVSIRSFPDNAEGNLNAEILFHDIIVENDEDVLEEEIENALEEGAYSKGTWACFITHSS